MKYTVSVKVSRDKSEDITWCKYKTHTIHREGNLPAVESRGGPTEYFVNGLYHRTDGPALIFLSKYAKKRYYLNGKHINVVSDDEFLQYQKLQAFS